MSPAPTSATSLDADSFARLVSDAFTPSPTERRPTLIEHPENWNPEAASRAALGASASTATFVSVIDNYIAQSGTRVMVNGRQFNLRQGEEWICEELRARAKLGGALVVRDADKAIPSFQRLVALLIDPANAHYSGFSGRLLAVEKASDLPEGLISMCERFTLDREAAKALDAQAAPPKDRSPKP